VRASGARPIKGRPPDAPTIESIVPVTFYEIIKHQGINKMDRIARNASLCYGCKICQLVCSFHHTGSFWPERSSIQVFRNPQTGIVRWNVDKTCDQCGCEERPLCVRYCSYEALRKVADENPKESENE